MALRTRPPTGQVAWPLLLVEGEDHAGKSYAAYSISADDRVGRTFVIDLGEGSADEYAALGPYEVVVHNGTYSDVLGQVEAAVAEPDDGRPNVIVLDTGTDLWETIKLWAEQRARSSRANQAKLRDDPEADIDIPMNIWNDAAERWYRVFNAMRRANTIGVVICRGKEVAKVRGGVPVAGETDYRVEAHKGTPYAVTAQVRATRPHTLTLVAVRSLTVDVPRNGIRLPDDNPLGHLIFDVLGAGTGSVPANIVHGVVGIDRADAKTRLMDRATEQGSVHPRDHAKAAWDQVVTTDAPEVTSDQWERMLVALDLLIATQDKFGGLDHDKAAEQAAAAGHNGVPGHEDALAAQGVPPELVGNAPVVVIGATDSGPSDEVAEPEAAQVGEAVMNGDTITDAETGEHLAGPEPETASQLPQDDPGPPPPTPEADSPTRPATGADAAKIAAKVETDVANMSVAEVVAELRAADLPVPDGAQAKRERLVTYETRRLLLNAGLVEA